MINKLISKSQVQLLEWDNGDYSEDWKKGYVKAINDVLDLEPIPTLGVDELKNIVDEIKECAFNHIIFEGGYDEKEDIIKAKEEIKVVRLDTILYIIDEIMKGV